jgi:hypothetical protein
MITLDTGDTRLIIENCRRFALLRNQAAYVLATALWETARTMEPVEEAFFVKNAETWRKRNLRYWPFYGRDYVQLTWLRNYQHAGKMLDVPLASDPALALDPEIAAEILVVGCLDGWFTGKKLADYITLQKSNFREARRVVNGLDKADTIAAIAIDYNNALLKEGYGVTPKPGAATANDHLRAYMNHADIAEGSARHTIAGALLDVT